MQIIRRLEQLVPALDALKAAGSLALVPTMGALHAGHMALIAAAKARADAVAATIFINPLQFGAGEDLGRYPRREPADAAMLEEAGCALLWLPGQEDIYPPGFATAVRVSGVADRWEGEARPGHFDGVATVVAKLLLAVRPEIALFGEKDFQQLAMIRHMARDLGLGVEIAGVATVRDPDGLAISSRNAYLTADQRARAVALPCALRAASEAIAGGGDIDEAVEQARRTMRDAGFAPIDYVALVDSATLEPVKRDGGAAGAMRLIAAATIDGTRLIDNIAVAAP